MAVYTQQNRIGSELAYEGDIINLRVDQCELNGRRVVREVVEHNGGVVILCQPSPEQIVLIKQYRYSVNQDLIEFPAGRIEKGEDPLPAAQRELTEETGYEANQWSELTRFFSAPGFCNEVLYLYRATDVRFSGKNLDEDEETEVILLDIAEAWELVKSGKVKDAKTTAGIAMLYSELCEKKLAVR